jgi:hypothetical protein
MKCTACGSSSLVEGELRDGHGARVSFKPDDLPLLKSAFGLGNAGINAYACLHCQNLQLVVRFSKEELERHQHFEGEQPGVLERLNSEPKGIED